MVHVLRARGVNADRVRAGNEVHQIEEVTALLDESPPGVAGEPVPIVYFGKEREAMLAACAVCRPYRRAPPR